MSVTIQRAALEKKRKKAPLGLFYELTQLLLKIPRNKGLKNWPLWASKLPAMPGRAMRPSGEGPGDRAT